MNILSIDVGIKNLAYCLLDTTKIVVWDVVNLCGNNPLCSRCTKMAKFAQTQPTATIFFCNFHAKKSGLLLPNAKMNYKKMKKMKLCDLHKIISDYNITITANTIKKEDVLNQIETFMNQHMLTSVANIKANEFDLIQLGIALRKAFDDKIKPYLSTITHIIIENQISPIANRMKTLQGMIAQYFIMHDKTQLSFVSAANKLKGYTDIATDTSTYTARKKEGIIVAFKLLNERYSVWLAHFTGHKKKDDLADAFLQGIWFLNKNKLT